MQAVMQFAHNLFHSVYEYNFFAENETDANRNNKVYNPWPGYSFSGKLRPYEVVGVDTFWYVEMTVKIVLNCGTCVFFLLLISIALDAMNLRTILCCSI